MNPWMVLVVLATAALITLLFRGPQPRKSPTSDERTEPPQPGGPPPMVRVVPVRRRFPPPLLVQPVAKVEPAPRMVLPVPAVKLVAPMATPAKKPSPVALQLVDMLKNQQSIQAAVLLREVLGPPLCRRRR